MDNMQLWNRKFLDNLPVAVACHEVIFNKEKNLVEFVFVEANSRFENIAGLTRQELIGKSLHQVLSNLHIQSFDWPSLYHEVLQNRNQSVQFESFFAATGQYFNIVAYREDDENHLVTIFEEITFQKHRDFEKEKTLQEKHFTQAIINSSNSNICVLDEKGTIITVNKSWMEFAKTNEGELEKVKEGVNYLEVCESVRDEERKEALKFASELRSVINGKKDYYEVEYPCDAPDKKRWFIAAVTPFAEAVKAPRKVLITHTEITPIKEMENELRKSEAKYRQLVESLQEGIWVIDKDGYTTFTNQALSDMLGYTIKEIHGKKIFEFMDKEEAKKARLALMRRTQGISENEERVFNHKEGYRVTVQLSTSPIFDEEGNYNGALASMRDISERKKMEEELKESRKQLEEAYNKLKEELNKAAKLHERVLPAHIPQSENISIAAHFQPAEHLGGDYYNVTQVGDKLVFYLSDVAGHGLEGALVSVFIKETIDNYTKLTGEELLPSKILTYLAGHFASVNYSEEQIICAFMGILDLNTFNLDYSSAGFQNYPLIKWEDGRWDKLISTGLFINRFIPEQSYNFQQRSIYLQDGVTILISTDGLTEQSNGETWFYEHYEEVFYRYSHLPPEVISQAINKEFCLFNNRSLVGDDDITFLVLKLGEKERGEFHWEIATELEELQPFYDEVVAFLKAHPEKDNFITCLHELICNAMEHGNGFDPDKKVGINIILEENYILAQVEDEGEGFDWWNNIERPLEIEDLTERGRGISLISMLSGELFYNNKGNRATLLLNI